MKAKLKSYLSTKFGIVHDPFWLDNKIPEKLSPYCPYVGIYSKVTRHYHMPIHQTNLCQLSDTSHLKQSQIHIVRDGLLPLLDFFMRFPCPINSPVLLAIPKEHIDYVPKAWSEFVTPYTVSTMPVWDKQLTKRNRETLIIKLYPCSYMNDPKQAVEYIKNNDFDNFKHIAIMTPYGHSYFDSHEVANKKQYEIINCISKKYPDKVEVFTENELYKSVEFSDSFFIDMNLNKIIWSDDVLNHRFLSMGSMPYIDEESPENEDSYFERLSLYHGISILEPRECGKKYERAISFINNLCCNKESFVLDKREYLPMIYSYLKTDQVSE